MGKPHGAHALHKLTAREVAAIKTPGRHSDGGGLYLSIPKGGGAGRWVWLGHFHGKQIEVGCGSAISTSLAAARAKATEYRDMVTRDINPVVAKKVAKAAAKGRRTFEQCAAELFELKQSEWRNALHRRQWADSLASCKVLGPLNIDEIDAAAVLRELQRSWTRTPATAARLRGR